MSMEWFRWYHETVSDPKFTACARKAKQPKVAVIAVWAAILEYASQQKDRGSVVGIDQETLSACLDLDDEDLAAIFAALVAKGLIQNDRVAKWSKRQVRREDDSKERVRRYRAKNSDVTPGNASVTQKNTSITQGNASVTEVAESVTAVTHIESESESESDTDKDLDSTFSGTNKSRRQSTRAGEILTTTDGGFFELTPARIALALQQGFTDLGWVEAETERFVARNRGQQLGHPDKAWLAWMEKGNALGMDHRPTRPSDDDFPLGRRPHL